MQLHQVLFPILGTCLCEESMLSSMVYCNNKLLFPLKKCRKKVFLVIFVAVTGPAGLVAVLFMPFERYK